MANRGNHAKPKSDQIRPKASEYNIQNDPTPETNEKYGEKSHKNE